MKTIAIERLQIGVVSWQWVYCSLVAGLSWACTKQDYVCRENYCSQLFSYIIRSEQYDRLSQQQLSFLLLYNLMMLLFTRWMSNVCHPATTSTITTTTTTTSATTTTTSSMPSVTIGASISGRRPLVAVSDASEQITTDYSTTMMTTIDAFVSNNCTCLGSGLYYQQ